MATVLVTGASGFIGGHLAEALVAHGDRVRCLVRATSDISTLQSLDVELVFGDINDAAVVERAVRGTEIVFHVAGLTKALRKSHLWDVNEQGTATIAAACANQTSPPIHIYVSSIAAGGPTRQGLLRVESDPANPISNYGRSKLAGERASAAHAGNVPTTIVRPGIVLGPRNRDCLPIFETIDLCGIHPVAGFRSPPLSFIPIEQLVDLLIRAAQSGARLPKPGLQSDHPGQGYYHATIDEFPNYAEFGRLIGRALGRSLAIAFPIAMPFPFVAAGVNELIARWRGRPDSFNIDKIREASVDSWACSSKLAQRELGYRPTGTLAEQLQADVDWYRENGWLRTRQVRRAAS